MALLRFKLFGKTKKSQKKQTFTDVEVSKIALWELELLGQELQLIEKDASIKAFTQQILINKKDEIINKLLTDNNYRTRFHKFIKNLFKQGSYLSKPTVELNYIFNFLPDLGGSSFLFSIGKEELDFPLQLVSDPMNTISYSHHLIDQVNKLQSVTFGEQLIKSKRLQEEIAKRIKERCTKWIEPTKQTYTHLNSLIKKFNTIKEKECVDLAMSCHTLLKKDIHEKEKLTHNPFILMWQYILEHLSEDKKIDTRRKEFVIIVITMLKAMNDNDVDKAAQIALAGIAISAESALFSIQRRVMILASLLKMVNPETTDIGQIIPEFVRKQYESLSNIEHHYGEFQSYLMQNSKHTQLLTLFKHSLNIECKTENQPKNILESKPRHTNQPKKLVVYGERINTHNGLLGINTNPSGERHIDSKIQDQLQQENYRL